MRAYLYLQHIGLLALRLLSKVGVCMGFGAGRRFYLPVFLKKLVYCYAGAVMMVIGGASAALGQPDPGAVDTGFNPADVLLGGESFNHSVTEITLQQDGKAVVGGNFSTYNGIGPANRIIRLHADGTADDSFNTGGGGFDGTESAVYSITQQNDGRLLVGGLFSSYNGINRSKIARLYTDGSLDESFNPGTGFNRSVQTIVVQPDGKMVVGGSFTSYNGTLRNGIVRLHADGSLDNSFNTGSGFYDYSTFESTFVVSSVVLQADGKVVVGGRFITYNGTVSKGIIRLNTDGSPDESFNTGTGFSHYGNKPFITSIVMQSDGKLLVGGNFTSYNGLDRKGIARINEDGTLDATFNPGTGFNATANTEVSTIALQADGKVVVGGGFNTFNGLPFHKIVRLNSDGTADGSFNTGASFDKPIYSIALQSESKVIAGGDFTAYNGKPRNYIARLHHTGSLDDSFSHVAGFDIYVNTVAVQNDNKIIMGGRFVSYNGLPRRYITRLNTDGSPDESFDPGTGFDNAVTAVNVQNDGMLVVTGSFTSYNGIGRNRVARLHADGSLDASFDPGGGFDGTTLSCVLQSNGKVYIGGTFTAFNGISRNRLVRLNADGSLDETFNTGTGFNDSVQTIAVQPDGKVVVGGNFTSFNGTEQNRLIRLHADGSLDESFNTGTGFNGPVYTIVLQPDGRLLVGGAYFFFNGSNRNHIIRLQADGSRDDSFYPRPGGFGSNTVTYVAVYTIALQPDGKAVVGGSFTSFDGRLRYRIARLNADGNLDTSYNYATSSGYGFDGVVKTIVLQPDGKAIAGGYFTHFNGNLPWNKRNKIARLHGGEGSTLSAGKERQAGVEVLVYPNPGKGDINLIITGAEAVVGAAKLILVNSGGRQVFSGEVQAAEAQSGLKLPASGLSAGIYFLTISTRSGSITRKLVLTE